MILKLASALMAGFMVHQVRPFLLRFAHGWRDLLMYGVGALGAAPFVALMHEEFDELSPRHRVLVAYFVAYAAYGLGVLLGWLHDSAEEGQ